MGDSEFHGFAPRFFHGPAGEKNHPLLLRKMMQKRALLLRMVKFLDDASIITGRWAECDIDADRAGRMGG